MPATSPRRLRFTLRTLLVLVALAALSLALWTKLRVSWITPSVFDTGSFDSEVHAWTAGDTTDAVPGIDEGSLLRVRTGEARGLVIWTDFQWSPRSGGGRMYGSLAKGTDDITVHWRWTAEGGDAGTLVINDKPYAVSQGCLFLVSTKDGNVRVEQLEKDASALMAIPSDLFRERLRALPRTDKNISTFFLDAAGRK